MAVWPFQYPGEVEEIITRGAIMFVRLPEVGEVGRAGELGSDQMR